VAWEKQGISEKEKESFFIDEQLLGHRNQEWVFSK